MFSHDIREQKIKNIMTMLEKKLGRKVEWERDEAGRVRIPLEYARDPSLGVEG